MPTAGEFDDNLISSSERPIRLAMRPDLVMERQTFQGRCYRVLKDPLTLRFYRFEEEEFAILELLDGQTSPATIQRQFAERFAPQRLGLSELQSFCSQLFRTALVISTVAGQGRQLTARRQRHTWQQRKATWTNLLCVRFPGINPDRFLDGLNYAAGWVFSPAAVLLGLLFMFSALVTVAVHFDSFLQRLPEFQQFFAIHNAVLLVLVLAVTKVLHELGHGLACKRMGAQCHEMGLLLLVLTPCLYCNVSDSWMLPNKWHRAAIGAAGIYVELLLAASCTFVWWFSHVGTLHYLALNVMFVCSVSTLVFNANPLLRYDGYYILSDIIEIPNLRQKANAILRRAAAWFFLGLAAASDPFLPTRHRFLFACYAVAAVIYRWLVVIAILWFLYKLFEPYGIKIVGQCLTGFVLYGLIVIPIWQMVAFFRTPGRFRQVQKLRFAFLVAVAGGLVITLLLVPLPFYIACQFRLQPRNASPVYVDVPGRLQQLLVRDGQRVRRGQDLVRLTNLDMQRGIIRLEGKRSQQLAKLDSLRLRAHKDVSALLVMAEAEETLQILDQQISKRYEDMQRLTIQSPEDGVLVASRKPAPPPTAHRLATWSGNPLTDQNQGAFLAAGVEVCRIVRPGQWEAILSLDENVVPFLQKDQKVTLFLNQLPGTRLQGNVEQISNLDSSVRQPGHPDVHPDRAARPDGADAESRQLNSDAHVTTYEAQVPLTLEDTLIFPGGRGRAKIHAGHRSLGRRLVDYLRRTFHFEA